jgi:organic radical activating enzyme
MANFIEKIHGWFTRTTPLSEGVHHLQVTPEDRDPYRLHLRLRSDGTGILIVNAATVLHLNPTAAEFAFHFVKGTHPEDAARIVASRYRVGRQQALQDFTALRERIETMIDIPDLDPISYLDFERVAPHSQELTAPLRIDCALTYSLPKGADPTLAPTKRVDRELTTQEWQTIIDNTWQVGIPHIIFTGGEPTLRDDLPELIAHAERNGQVTGLLSDGLKLVNKKYLQTLLQTGLDHLMLVLQADKKASWKAVDTVMPEDLYTTVHLTLHKKNIKAAPETIEMLAQMGVGSLSLSAADETAHNTLPELRELAAQLGLTLTWDLPVPYSSDNPVAMETATDEAPAGAGRAWLYIEPDGDVLPAQGCADQILGNIVKDPWERIYSH